MQSATTYKLWHLFYLNHLVPRSYQQYNTFDVIYKQIDNRCLKHEPLTSSKNVSINSHADRRYKYFNVDLKIMRLLAVWNHCRNLHTPLAVSVQKYERPTPKYVRGIYLHALQPEFNYFYLDFWLKGHIGNHIIVQNMKHLCQKSTWGVRVTSRKIKSKYIRD